MYFSEDIPEPQFCIKCNENVETTEDEEGRTWVENLIGIPLDNFLGQYPSIGKQCDDPSSFAIDLCESCEKLYVTGKIGISLEEIKKHAYRFI